MALSSDAQAPAGWQAARETSPLLENHRDHRETHAGSVEAPASSATSSHDSDQSTPRLRTVLSAIGLGALVILQAVNISMLTTTQGHIAQELDAFESVTWFNSAYLIAMSALSPINGKLSSIFPPRWCVFTSAMVLALGCGISSLATRTDVFILGRTVSGAGSGGLLTVGAVIILEMNGPKSRGFSISLLNSGYTVGVAAGAAIAGALVSHTSWRALFYLQIPIAICATIILVLALPANLQGKSSKAEDALDDQDVWRRLGQIDYLGALLLTLCIVLMLYSLSAPGEIPILPLILLPFGLAIFVYTEIYIATDPVIPLTLLKSRGMLMTCLCTVGYMMARWTVLFYTPTYALAVREWSPSSSGSILFPTNLGFATGSLAVGWLHIRRPGAFYLPSIISLAIFPCTLAALAALATAQSPAWAFVIVVFFNGAVTGAILNYTFAHLLHITPKSTHYVAMSLVATFRGFAGSFGSAIGGGVFSRRLRASLEAQILKEGIHPPRDFVRRVLGSPEIVSSLTGKEHVIAVKGYEDALKFLWLAGAGVAALMILFQVLAGQRGADDSPRVGDQSADEVNDDT